MGEYGKAGASVSGLVHAQMAKAKKQGRTLSYDAAYEEMIADSMTTMLSDGKVVEKLAKLAKKDKSLAEKIKEFIDKLVQDIKKAYVGIKPDTKEGQFVQEMIGSAEKLQELFYDALVHAGENYKDANVKENSEKSLIPDGIKLSERDSDGNILTNAQQEYFKHSKIRDAEGNLLVVRHGTDAEFNIFDFSKSGKNGKAEGYGFYFSDDKKITSKYGGIQKELYLNITKPLYNNKRTITKTELVKLTNALIDFDIETYKSEELTWQDSFISNYVMTYDMSRQSAVREFVNQIWDYNTNDQDIVFEIAQSDGRMYNNSLMRDFYNVLTESIGYDGIIAEWNHGDGNSNVYVAFESNQSKNTTNTNPTSDPDIRYDERDYSYESLISKPDMKITQIEENVPKNRADVIFEAKKNATQIGKRHKDGSVYVHVNDIDTDVILGTRGLQHGLDRRFKTLAPVTIKAGEILKNSIRINEMIPKTNSAFESYILVGAAKNKNGELYIVQSVINKYNLELTSMDVLYAINAKTEPELGKKKNRLGADPRGGQHKGSGLSDSMNTATLNAPRSTENPLSVTNSIISISELLDLVNKYFPDVLPESVLRHYNYTERPEGELGESALYSERHEESLSNRTLLANALENAVQNDIEKKRLSEYKEKIEIMEGEEKKLSTVRKEIKELSFAPGKRDKAKIRSLQDEATTLANRLNTYDRQLLRLEASAALKNVLEREKAAVRKKQKQQDSEILRAYKQQAAAKQEAIISRYQASREKAIDSRHKTVVRSKIKGIVNDLNKLLLNPTKDKHVPIELQKPVAEALDILNMDTLGADKRVAYYNNLIAKESDPDIVADLKKTRDHIQGQGENLMRKIDALKSAYSEIKNSEDPLIADAHDEVIESTIQSVIKEIGDTSIRDMSLSQLESVYDMFKMVLTKVRDANKEFAGEQKRTIEEMGQAVSSEIRRIGGEKERQLSAMNWLKKQGWDMLKPIYAFRMIGSDTLTYLYNKVRNGEDTWYTDVSQAKDFLGEQRRKYGFYAWDFDSRATFTAKSGEKFSLSLEQIMSIYAYSKREQAMKHLLEGGIVFDNSIKVVEKNKVGMPLKYDVSTAKAYSLSQEMLDSIIYTLTAEQKAFVDSMQEYLSTVMGEKGNEISLKMYGIKLFKERFYFPLKSSNYYMNFKPEEVGETRIKNSGFTKETVKKANNPVVLSDFSSVWANHVNDMSMYHAFVLPIEDFNRVFNYRTAVAGNAETTSVKAALANAYGTGAETYIRNLLTDINGGARTQGTDIVDKFMGLAKKNAVFASLSVGIQQLSAIPRAFSYINPKYFGHAIIRSLNLVRHKSDWGEIKRYAPVAGIKEMGYFDTGVGRNTVDWLNEHEYDGVKEKVFAFLKDSEYRKKATDDVLSALPAFVDEIGWVQIWHAVKKEIAATTNLAIESEEFLQKCGERFTEVVTLTQVYDSTLSRSGMMRNKDRLMKMATAFMAEPTVQLNMLVDAGIQGKRKGGLTGFKTVAGTTGAVMASMVINSLLKAIVMAGRDDDEDKTYAEKYVKSLVDDIKSNLNPLTLVPFFKDVVSVFSGYDVNRMDMTLFSDLKKALDAFDNEKKSTVDKITGLSSALSGFFGIPAKNVERDIRAIYNTILSFTNGQNTTKQGLETAIKEGWTGETESDSQQLYNAIMDGDEEHIERIKSRFKDQDAINAAMRKTLRENDHRIREAAQAKIEIRNSEYESIVYEIKEEENFSLDIIIGAINNEITALKKETEEQNTEAEQENETDEMEKLSSIYSASDINRAFDKGKTAAAIEIIEDILKVETENYIRKGYKKKEAEQKAASSLRSSMTSYWKPLFLEAYKKGDKQEQERIRRILKESKLYGRANDVVKTTQQWIKDMRKKGQ